jgi:hypothetical protein
VSIFSAHVVNKGDLQVSILAQSRNGRTPLNVQGGGSATSYSMNALVGSKPEVMMDI